MCLCNALTLAACRMRQPRTKGSLRPVLEEFKRDLNYDRAFANLIDIGTCSNEVRKSVQSDWVRSAGLAGGLKPMLSFDKATDAFFREHVSFTPSLFPLLSTLYPLLAL